MSEEINNNDKTPGSPGPIKGEITGDAPNGTEETIIIEEAGTPTDSTPTKTDGVQSTPMDAGASIPPSTDGMSPEFERLITEGVSDAGVPVLGGAASEVQSVPKPSPLSGDAAQTAYGVSRTVTSGSSPDGTMPTTTIPSGLFRQPTPVASDQTPYVMTNGVDGSTTDGGSQSSVSPGPSGSGVPLPPAPPAIIPQGSGWETNPDGTSVASSRGSGMPKWAVGLISAGAAVVLSLGIGFGALSAGWVKIPSDAVGSSVSSIGKTGSKNVTATGVDSWASVASEVADSVVSIQAGSGNAVSTGSGAVLDSEGHIVTNNHVVAGSKSIMVTMSNGQIIKASIVGTDPSTDLAVIKLDSLPKSGLNPIKFADSDDLVVGQGVMSIGSPLGYANTVTTGVISATDRPVVIATEGASNGYSATDAIQIDAAINPGNSGGPTFDSSGRVIGINSSIASVSTNQSEAGNVGIGFAIPSDLVKSITSSIIKNGEAEHVWLGVSMSNQDTTVTVDGVTRSGAEIVGVTSGSPADASGVQDEDVIIAWDGEPIEDSSNLMSRVRSAALGDKAKLTVVRDGKTVDVDVVFDQVDPNGADADGSDSDGEDGRSNEDLGNRFEDLLREFGFSR